MKIGIISNAQDAKVKTEEAEEREKLELVLSELHIEKHTVKDYNEEQYIDNKLLSEQMKPIEPNGNMVIVDKWMYEIDRSVPKIVGNRKKANLNNNIVINTNQRTYAGRTVSIMEDIDLSSVCGEEVGSWEPIGTSETSFAGIFNGNYHTISNLYIYDQTNNNNISFFRSLTSSNAKIENLIFDKFTYYRYSSDPRTIRGGVVCGTMQKATISRIWLKDGSIEWSYYNTAGDCITLGGLIGLCINGRVSECINSVDVYLHSTRTETRYGDWAAGGLIGSVQQSCDISNCYVRGNVTVKIGGGVNAGGFIGWVSGTLKIANCYFSGTSSASRWL